MNIQFLLNAFFPINLLKNTFWKSFFFLNFYNRYSNSIFNVFSDDRTLDLRYSNIAAAYLNYYLTSIKRAVYMCTLNMCVCVCVSFWICLQKQLFVFRFQYFSLHTFSRAYTTAIIIDVTTNIALRIIEFG